MNKPRNDRNGMSNFGTNRMNGTDNLNRNGAINGGMTNGRNVNGARLSGGLADQIQALCFVKTEIELYLDTHPDCAVALDYYGQTIAELKRLIEQYENTVGPLTAMGNVSAERWKWIDGPWPWQQAGDFAREEGKR